MVVMHVQDALGARTAGDLAAALGDRRNARRLEEALVGLEVRRAARAVRDTRATCRVTYLVCFACHCRR